MKLSFKAGLLRLCVFAFLGRSLHRWWSASSELHAVRKSDLENAALVTAIRKLPDHELARLLRRSHVLVRTRRRGARRSEACGAKAPDWTLEEMLLLGADADAVIAAKLGRSRRAVGFKRRRLGIPAIARNRPWTKKEIRLLGTQTDREVARRIGRKAEAVASKRRKLRIANVVPAPPQRRWTPAELRLLGTMPDGVLAARIKRGYQAVVNKRRERRIPVRRRAGFRSWSKEELKLLGTMPDAKVALMLGCSEKKVRGRRENARIPVFERQLRKWTAADDKLLGTISDQELARRLGVSANAICHRRCRLGILLPKKFHRPKLSGRQWTTRELALFGRCPDHEIARRVGCTIDQVRYKRKTLELGSPGLRRWTSEELCLVGTLPDTELARHLGRSVGAVEQRRFKLKRPLLELNKDIV